MLTWKSKSIMERREKAAAIARRKSARYRREETAAPENHRQAGALLEFKKIVRKGHQPAENRKREGGG